jgi:hypothetical protein
MGFDMLKVKNLKEILNQFKDDDDVVLILPDQEDSSLLRQKVVTQVAKLVSKYEDNDAIALYSSIPTQNLDISLSSNFKETLYDGWEE